MGMRINGVNNVDIDHERYVVARIDEETRELWFYGSWSDKDTAQRVAWSFDNGIVVDMEED